MYTGNVLPYAPRLYEVVSYVITSTSDPQLLVRPNPKRVRLMIVPGTLLLATNPYYSVNSGGGNVGTVSAAAANRLDFTWIEDYILCCSAVYANGFGIGQVFSMTEVLFSLSKAMEDYRVTRKPISTTAKIKGFSSVIQQRATASITDIRK